MQLWRARRGWYGGWLLAWLILSLWSLTPAWATPAPAAPGSSWRSPQGLEARLISAERELVAGSQGLVALQLKLPSGWHVYWRNGGEWGLPTSVEWQLPPGVKLGASYWPPPKRAQLLGEMSLEYSGSPLLVQSIEVPATWPAGKTLEVIAKASWLECSSTGCFPGQATLRLELPVLAAGKEPTPSQEAELFKSSAPLWPKDWAGQAEAWVEGEYLNLHLTPAEKSEIPAEAKFWEFYPWEGTALNLKADPQVQRVRVGYWLQVPLRAGSSLEKVAGLLVALDSNSKEPQAAWNLELALGSKPSPWPPAGSLEATSQAKAPAGSPLNWGQVAGYTLGAFLGGILLNLMPCVFPVLSLKVLSFVEHGSQEGSGPRSSLKQALWFSLGVLLSFWLLALILLLLRASGESLGWGFQMQSPLFISLLSLLFLGIALNLWGVFEVGLGLTRWGGVESGSGALGSMASGALAVVAATPCTAPFMGAALGFSLTAPALVALLIFGALALGMALPYLLLASWPALLRRLPRPGRWMESLKQFLAFPLILTEVYFLWVLAQQRGADGAALLGAALVAAALGGWIYGRFIQSSPRWAWSGLLLSLVVAGFLVAGACQPREVATSGGSDSLAAVPWSQEAVQEAIDQKKPLFIDFGAAWCLTCQVNERGVLADPQVQELFQKRGVIFMKADWTNRDPAITAALESYGRSGVPLYVYYPPTGEGKAKILPEILSVGLLISILE